MLKNPLTTATNPAHASLQPYPTANDTLRLLDKLIGDSGITPSTAVLEARADIGYTASQETEQLADLDAVKNSETMHLTDALRIVSHGTTDTSITDSERRAATTALLIGQNDAELAKRYRTLENQITFRTSREAARRLRTLGDDILSGLLQPWIDRVMAELEPLAHVLSDGGWEAIYAAADYRRINYDTDADISDDIAAHASAPAKVRPHLRVMRAMTLTKELEHVALVAHELREHGILPRADDPNFPNALYAWKHADRLPHMKYTTHTAESAALWIAQAIAAGAKPTARTAKQAEAARPLPIPADDYDYDYVSAIT